MTPNSVFLVTFADHATVTNITQVHTALIGETFENLNYDPDSKVFTLNITVAGQQSGEVTSYTSGNGGNSWTF